MICFPALSRSPWFGPSGGQSGPLGGGFLLLLTRPSIAWPSSFTQLIGQNLAPHGTWPPACHL
jgi:hypothetical protein